MYVAQDYNLVDHLAHFDRERIPERVVHAKGAGAFGFFEVRVWSGGLPIPFFPPKIATMLIHTSRPLHTMCVCR